MDPGLLGPVWSADRMLLGDRTRWERVEVARAADERAVLVAVLREGRTTLLGRGHAEAAVELVAGRTARRADAGEPTAVGWMTLPRGAVVPDELLDALGVAPFSTWDWMVTVAPPPRARAEDDVVVLDPTRDAEAIVACLAEANPGTTADPTAPTEAAWVGVRTPDGALAGVFGASLRGGPGPGDVSWHLHGLGVRPSVRGRGLGAALTAAITRAGLAAGACWVSLGMYADNEHARRIYRRLGFVTDAVLASFGPAGARRPPT